MNDYTFTVLSYIRTCVENIAINTRIRSLPNRKPWKTIENDLDWRSITEHLNQMTEHAQHSQTQLEKNSQSKTGATLPHYLKLMHCVLWRPRSRSLMTSLLETIVLNAELLSMKKHSHTSGHGLRISYLTAHRFRLGPHLSSSLALSIGAAQVYVLSPLFYSIFTHDRVSSHPSNTIIKFADDATVMEQICNGIGTAYRD